jgi:hypothetical protein
VAVEVVQVESVGSVQPGSAEEMWAAYEVASTEWEKAHAVKQAFRAASEQACDAEDAAWRRSREAFDAWWKASQAR